MKKKGSRVFVGILVLIVVAFLLGPTPSDPIYNPDFPPMVSSPELAEEKIKAIDAAAGNIRPNNESRIFWANDSTKEQTEYCLLYLHGFSASPEEGNPVHINFARHFGMNAFIPRQAEHGLVTEDALLDNTPDVMWESVKQSFVLAKAMGKKIILMGCSTGGSLALKLVSDFPDDIAGLMLYSPNIRLYSKASAVLSLPWGLQIGRMISGGEYRYAESDPETDPFWYTKQRVEGVVYLQQLVKSTMKSEVFNNINTPTYLAYYYKDEENQDNTVSVEAMKWMYEELGTPDEMKRQDAFPEAGEHVLCCELTSGSWEKVQAESIKFAEDILKIDPKY